MKQIELSAGTIDYQDTGGDGPPIVLLHGLMMDASLWDGPIAELSLDHRCVAPTLPLGAHRHGMHSEADLSLPAIAQLVAEFLDRLDLSMTPAARLSSYSWAMALYSRDNAWGGSYSSRARRSTTSLPG